MIKQFFIMFLFIKTSLLIKIKTQSSSIVIKKLIDSIVNKQIKIVNNLNSPNSNSDYYNVLYSDNQFTISTDVNINNTVIEGFIKRELIIDGWNKLNISMKKTNSDISDYIKMYLSGYVEGLLTYEDISRFYYNLKLNNHHNSKEYKDLTQFFTQVNNNIIDNLRNEKTIVDGLTREYSNKLTLSYFQLLGIIDSYNIMREQNKNLELLSYAEFLIIQADGEISELLRIMKYKSNKFGYRVTDKQYFYKAFGVDNKVKYFNARLNMNTSRCSALIKLIKEGDQIKDVLSGHVTWSDYAEGIKYLKQYSFVYDNNYFTTIKFSAYPGTISSTDDFYITSNKLFVTETTLDVYDLNIYKDSVKVSNYIPNFLRVNTATLFSKTGDEWINNFKQFNSNTYSSQWIIIDYKQIASINSKTATNGLAFVLEQIPNNMLSLDITDKLIEESYFGGFNKAFFSDTKKDLNSQLIEQLYGKELGYDGNSRKKLFNDLFSTINDMKTFKDVLMYNGYKFKGSTIDYVKDPSYENPAEGLSSRYDLSPLKSAFGGTDFKATSLDLIKKMNYIAHNGPTTENNENLTPFTWTRYNGSIVSHIGVPEKLDFEYLLIDDSNRSKVLNNKLK